MKKLIAMIPTTGKTKEEIMKMVNDVLSKQKMKKRNNNDGKKK
jgi:hypothetical protein